jgi:hypothetical protein
MRNYAARVRRVFGMLLLGVLLTVLFASPVAAADQLCTDQSGRRIPNCTVEGPDFGTSTDTGIPSGFIAIMVLVGIAGVVVTIYKVSMARDMARLAGMDPDRATAMTLLEDDGLEATYLASNLRPQSQAPAPAPVPRTVTERLEELETLREAGRVTQAEYDERRTAILGSL